MSSPIIENRLSTISALGNDKINGGWYLDHSVANGLLILVMLQLATKDPVIYLPFDSPVFLITGHYRLDHFYLCNRNVQPLYLL